MTFEYDSTKSRSNLRKHGIDFLGAQALWDDPMALVVPARTVDEERFAIIGMLEGKKWTSIFSLREGRIRIISARRSRHEEERRYDQR